MSNLYRTADNFFFPLGEEKGILYRRATQKSRLIRRRTFAALTKSTRFDTLENHLHNLRREMSLSTDEEKVLREEMQELAQQGFLVSLTDLLSGLKVKAAPKDGDTDIDSIGIVTCDRPNALERVFLSFVENAKRSDRQCRFVVADDSRSLASIKDNQKFMREAAKNYGYDIYYVGQEEKRAFIDRLTDNSDVPSDVVRFALSDPLGIGFTCGANRNALLLDHAGELFLSADDDVTCALTDFPGHKNALKLVTEPDPTEFFFFRTSSELNQKASFRDVSVLSIHEQLLGKDLGRCIHEFGKTCAVNFDAMSADFMKNLIHEPARICVTMTGVAGDSGMGAHTYFLWLKGNSRARLLASEDLYEAAITTRQIVRKVESATVSDVPFLMTMLVGLDAREILPPFFPVLRNSDMTFGVSLRRILNAYIGYVPWAVQHSPPEPRVMMRDSIWKIAQPVSVPEIICDFLNSRRLDRLDLNIKERFKTAGDFLIEQSKIPEKTLMEFVRFNAWGARGRTASMLENLLANSNGKPDFWAEDVKRHLEVLREKTAGEDFVLPCDLPHSRDKDDIYHLSRELIRKFGELLFWWPEIFETSKELKSQKTPLALRVY